MKKIRTMNPACDMCRAGKHDECREIGCDCVKCREMKNDTLADKGFVGKTRRFRNRTRAWYG